MTKIYLLAALPLILSATTIPANALAPQQGTMPAHGTVGRETTAPPWSAACMSDHGPTECNEPMWIYGSPDAVVRYKRAH